MKLLSQFQVFSYFLDVVYSFGEKSRLKNEGYNAFSDTISCDKSSGYGYGVDNPPFNTTYPVIANNRDTPQNRATSSDMSNSTRGPAFETLGQSARPGYIINLISQRRQTLGSFSSPAIASWSDWKN